MERTETMRKRKTVDRREVITPKSTNYLKIFDLQLEHKRRENQLDKIIPLFSPH